MATTEEFLSYGGRYFVEKMKENVQSQYENMLEQSQRENTSLRRELFSFEYFIWDYMLHSLWSKSESENRLQQSELFDGLRTTVTETIQLDKDSMIDIGALPDACDAYRAALSEGDAMEEILMNLGNAFGKRLKNHDLLISMQVTHHFKLMWKNWLPFLEKLTKDFLAIKS